MDAAIFPTPIQLRIIRDHARHATFNMAADRFLMGYAARTCRVILRTYSWDGPAITLGCMQRAETLLDVQAMNAGGVCSISRITGGRAVLHWNNLTYSCAFPIDMDPMGRSIAQSYAVISRCLAAGLLNAGIATETHDSPPDIHSARNQRLPCFCSPNRNELMVKGKKLIGSAQKRTRYAVLQHGSIPLDNHFCRLGEFMNASPAEREEVAKLFKNKCTCVREIVPSVEADFLAECIEKGFAETLGLAVEKLDWTEEELNAIGC